MEVIRFFFSLDWILHDLIAISLRKHPFLLALRRWGRENVPNGEERGETDVFAV